PGASRPLRPRPAPPGRAAPRQARRLRRPRAAGRTAGFPAPTRPAAVRPRPRRRASAISTSSDPSGNSLHTSPRHWVRVLRARGNTRTPARPQPPQECPEPGQKPPPPARPRPGQHDRPAGLALAPLRHRAADAALVVVAQRLLLR